MILAILFSWLHLPSFLVEYKDSDYPLTNPRKPLRNCSIHLLSPISAPISSDCQINSLCFHLPPCLTQYLLQYHHGINHLSFSRGSLLAHTIIHFYIVWRFTYSIRLILIEAKHRCKRYKYKNILKKYKKCQKYTHKTFSFRVASSSSRWIHSSAINERNVCTSSTDNETAIFWFDTKSCVRSFAGCAD